MEGAAIVSASQSELATLHVERLFFYIREGEGEGRLTS